MRLTINGQPREIAFDGVATIDRLLREVAPRGVPCAVELNRRVVPRAEHAQTTLHEGDHLEIVTLVGGG